MELGHKNGPWKRTNKNNQLQRLQYSHMSDGVIASEGITLTLTSTVFILDIKMNVSGSFCTIPFIFLYVRNYL